jgi:hypothetical protein
MATLTGGEGVKKYLESISGKLSNKATLRVGILEGATYPNGTPVALVASIQEFGAPKAGIPPRPFFRNAIAKHEAEWPKAIANLLVANGYDLKRTLDLAGQGIAGQIRQSIIDTNEPPLAPSTIRRKGHAKPLVDTGHMLNSVDHEVTEG